MVATVDFSTHKGKNILKAKAEVVANPRSALQQANRARFVALLAIGKMLQPILALGYKEYAGTVSWLNKFMSTNAYSGLMIWDPTPLSWITDLSKVVVAEGQLYPAPFSGASNSDTTLELQFLPTAIANQNTEDLFIGVAMCESDTVYSIKAVQRSAGLVVFTFGTYKGNLLRWVLYFAKWHHSFEFICRNARY